MNEHPSDRLQSELFTRLRDLSSSNSCLPHGEFQRLLDASPEGRKLPLPVWKEVVDFASDQCARWQAQWLFSPAASPDTTAAQEFESWRQLYATCSAALVERVPDVKEHLGRQHSLTALQHALQLQIEHTKGRPIRRLSSAILSRTAILLRRVGMSDFAERLYARALYPEGTVGRAGG
jgi:hypothetical protein